LSQAKVVVGDLKQITGIDGQNIIDSSLVPVSFQGRDFGGKSTYQVFNLEAMRSIYANFIDPETGDIVLPRGGIGGGQLVIPKGTTIIEDVSNIKARSQYEGLTQDEVNERRTKEVREKGIFAKTTSEGHNTDARWISAQAASTMSLGEDAKKFFNRVFLRELASLEDVGTVRSLLFSGDDRLSRMVQADIGHINSREAQQRIAQYRESILARKGRGDILLPHGAAQYAMISAWLPDVFNSLILESGGTLTEEQKSLSLRHDGGDDVAYFASPNSDMLGLFRNPATASGNLQVRNRAVDEQFQAAAK
jgi:hypothetical protein